MVSILVDVEDALTLTVVVVRVTYCSLPYCVCALAHQQVRNICFVLLHDLCARRFSSQNKVSALLRLGEGHVEYL